MDCLTEDQYNLDWEQLTHDEIIRQALHHAENLNRNNRNLPQIENTMSATKALGALRISRSWCQTHQEFRKNDFNFLQ